MLAAARSAQPKQPVLPGLPLLPARDVPGTLTDNDDGDATDDDEMASD
jgi:hypothetical protein